MCVRAQTCTMTALLFASELSCSFYIVLLLGFLPLSRPRLLLSLSLSFCRGKGFCARSVVRGVAACVPVLRALPATLAMQERVVRGPAFT